jgi:hypothetical protein
MRNPIRSYRIRRDDLHAIDEIRLILDGDGDGVASQGGIRGTIDEVGQVADEVGDGVVLQHFLQHSGRRRAVDSAGCGSQGGVAGREEREGVGAIEGAGEVGLAEQGLERAEACRTDGVGERDWDREEAFGVCQSIVSSYVVETALTYRQCGSVPRRRRYHR